MEDHEMPQVGTNSWPKAYDDVWEHDLLKQREKHRRAAVVIEGLEAAGLLQNGVSRFTLELVSKVLELWPKTARPGQEKANEHCSQRVAWETLSSLLDGFGYDAVPIDRDIILMVVLGGACEQYLGPDAVGSLSLQDTPSEYAETALPLDTLNATLCWIMARKMEGMHRKALGALARAQDKWGRKSAIHAQRAEVLWKLGNHRLALSEMATAAARDENDGTHPLAMVGWYLEAKDTKSALEALDEALTRMANWIKCPRRKDSYVVTEGTAPKGPDDSRHLEVRSLVCEVQGAISLVKQMELDPAVSLAALEAPKTKILRIRKVLERHVHEEEAGPPKASEVN